MPGGGERRTAAVTATRDAVITEAGIENLALMRTAGAGFENYIHDPLTTLVEAEERVLVAVAKASWMYSGQDIPFGPYWHGVRQALLETFVEHDSKSVQHTLYAMASAVLERYEDISEIYITMPATHCVPVDLSPFGLDNNNEVFNSAEKPSATMEARIKRDGS
jgi:urate oxidase